jgi:hypothetical protein
MRNNLKAKYMYKGPLKDSIKKQIEKHLKTQNYINSIIILLMKNLLGQKYTNVMKF